MRPSSIAALLTSARAAAAEADRAAAVSTATAAAAAAGAADAPAAASSARSASRCGAAPPTRSASFSAAGGGGGEEVAVNFYARRPATPSLAGRSGAATDSSLLGGGGGGGGGGTPLGADDVGTPLSSTAAAASAAGRGARPPPFVGGGGGGGGGTSSTRPGSGTRPSSVLSAISVDSLDGTDTTSRRPSGIAAAVATDTSTTTTSDRAGLSPSPPLLAAATMRPPSGRRTITAPAPAAIAEAIAALSAAVDALRAAVAALGMPNDGTPAPPPEAWAAAKVAAAPFVAAYDNTLRLSARATAAAAGAPADGVTALEAGIGAATAHHAAITAALLPWLLHFAAAHSPDDADADADADADVDATAGIVAAVGVLFVACSHRSLCTNPRIVGGGGGGATVAAALAAGARVGFMLTRNVGGVSGLTASLLADVCAWLLSLRPDGRLPHLVTRGAGVVVVSPALVLGDLVAGDDATLLEATCYAFGVLRNLAGVPAAAPALAAQGAVSLAVDAAAAAGLFIAGAGGGASERAAMQLAAQALHLLRAVAGDRVAGAALWRCNVVPTALALLASPRFLKYSEAVLLVSRPLARLAPKVQASEWLASPAAILLAGGPAAAFPVASTHCVVCRRRQTEPRRHCQPSGVCACHCGGGAGRFRTTCRAGRRGGTRTDGRRGGPRRYATWRANPAGAACAVRAVIHWRRCTRPARPRRAAHV